MRDGDAEELEARRRAIGRELRGLGQSPRRRELVREAMQLDRKIALLGRGRLGRRVPPPARAVARKGAAHGGAPAPRMRTVVLRAGRATHLLRVGPAQHGGPSKTLCGITLMGEPTDPVEDQNLARFLESLEEYDPPLCATCGGRCRGSLARGARGA